MLQAGCCFSLSQLRQYHQESSKPLVYLIIAIIHVKVTINRFGCQATNLPRVSSVWLTFNKESGHISVQTNFPRTSYHNSDLDGPGYTKQRNVMSSRNSKKESSVSPASNSRRSGTTGSPRNDGKRKSKVTVFRVFVFNSTRAEFQAIRRHRKFRARRKTVM
jgi:hypothetical protein